MGILSGPLDPEPRDRRRRTPPILRVELGQLVTHCPTGITGAVLSLRSSFTVVRDRDGRDHQFRSRDGDFLVDGQPVALRPAPFPSTGVRRTPSGSLDPGRLPARTARASRIFVEGRHDAELVEKVWGDDLRVEGVVVESLSGVDDLEAVVRGFGPGPGRRLGILVDHLVTGTREQRIASGIDHPDVLVAGHPFVDVWQAVKPSVLGIEAWPTVPRGEPWKEGICRAIGWRGTIGELWSHLLGRVRSYTDLEPALVGAVESLIDFVAPPDP